MKPITLTMQAFGSYGEKTTIDFRKLNHNLFLVTGDTGAGKSTIFDAMVFALYGQASSEINKKNGTDLQSDFADRDVEPFVELTFSERTGDNAGGEEAIYTVKRIPQHDRRKQRGNGGIRKINSSVSLIMPDGTEYPQKETNSKIEEIVGLSKSQFMQTGMIAQGEFMQTLRAKSEEKKPIFRKLFDTELYRRIVSELDSRRKERADKLAEIGVLCKSEISHIVIPAVDFKDDADKDEYAIKLEKVSGLKKELITSDSVSVLKLEELVLVMKEISDRQKKIYRDCKKKTADFSKKRDEKRDAYNEAGGLAEVFEKISQAEQELKQCGEREQDIAGYRKLIVKIRDAYDIQEKYNLYIDAENVAQKTRKKLEENEIKFPKLKKSLEEKEYTAIKNREDYESISKNFARIDEKTAKAFEAFDEIDKISEALKTAKELKKSAESAENAANLAFDELEKKETLWRKDADELANTNTLKANVSVQINELKVLIVDLDDLLQDIQKVKLQKDAVQISRKDYEIKSGAYNAKKEDYDKKERIFYDSQAGILAQERLEEGKPCPVCGSLEHPNPCTLAYGDFVLSREELENLSIQVQNAHDEMTKSSGKAKSDANLLAECEKNLNRRMENFSEEMAAAKPLLSYSDLNVLRDDLAKQQSYKEKELDSLDKKIRKLSVSKENLKEIGDKKEYLRKQKSECQKAAESVRTKLATIESSYEEHRNALEYDSRSDAEKKKQDAETAVKAAKIAAEDADKKMKEAKSEKEKVETMIMQLKAELPLQEKDAAFKRDGYDCICEEKHLNEDEWKSAAAKYSRNATDDFYNIITEHEKAKSAAKRTLDEYLKQAENKQKPDMDILKRESDSAENELTAAKETENDARRCYEANSSAYKSLAFRLSQQKEISVESERIERLYNILAGKVTGARMDIETFVQRYYLEQILYAANVRFREMSADQYELRMCKPEEAGSGRNKGLDLMVYSDITGKTREVNTLSGGESFMAALSLALGMADTISENSSAVNLDVMFIDEGFGSLDGHSREQSIKVLKQMAGGAKTIGIISHVSELKQEIDDQLIVTKDEKGSHVKWQLS